MTAQTDDPGFLKRWSARKLSRDDADAPAPDPEADPQPSQDTAHTGEDGVQGQTEGAPPSNGDEASQTPPPDLPDVDTLDADSDYSVFLGDNVPEDLTRMALRKLWRSDPALANLDGLNDYDSDYSMTGKVVEAVKTAYRVGRGYADNVAEDGEVQSPDADSTEVAQIDGEGRDEASADAPRESDETGSEDGETAIADKPDPGEGEAAPDAPGSKRS